MKQLILSLLIGMSLLVTSLQAEKKLVINTAILNNSVLQGSTAVVKELYQRMGVKLKIRFRPLKRALFESNRGWVDGEMMRTASIEKDYENLVRIPVVIGTMPISVFTKKEVFPVEGWESLKPYRIGFLRGMESIERGTKGMRRNRSNTSTALFQMLDKNRVDVVIFFQLGGLSVIKDQNLQGRVRLLSPPLMELKLYHYLHKKHQALIPEFTKVLRQMEQDGTVQRLIEQNEKEEVQY